MLLEELVFQALGEASMCWSETPSGVFDSENAKRIGNELVAAINKIRPAPETQTIQVLLDSKVIAEAESKYRPAQ